MWPYLIWSCGHAAPKLTVYAIISICFLFDLFFYYFLLCWNSRERPFICQECGRSFPLKRHLVTHSKFHAGERPFVCDECGESFAQENHLIMHSRFHGSLNPFVCADCGATFPRKFQLVNHGRIHGRVPHSCTVCGKEFLQKRTLVAHMRLYVYIGLWLIFCLCFFPFHHLVFHCIASPPFWTIFYTPTTSSKFVWNETLIWTIARVLWIIIWAFLF